jgi:hypothetical protein
MRLFGARGELGLHLAQVAARGKRAAGAGQNCYPGRLVLVQPLQSTDDPVNHFGFRNRVAHRRIIQCDRYDAARGCVEYFVGHVDAFWLAQAETSGDDPAQDLTSTAP